MRKLDPDTGREATVESRGCRRLADAGSRILAYLRGSVIVVVIFRHVRGLCVSGEREGLL